MDAVEELVESYGAFGRPVRRVLAALATRSWLLDELVAATAVPRRTVEEVLAAVGADLVAGDALRLRPERAGGYRQRYGRFEPDEAADPLLPEMIALRAGAPRPSRALDHVAATPRTALRRARWLAAEYDLAGAVLLCVGDHDLTALAACLVEPRLRAVVVDVDERVLAYIDRAAVSRGLDVRCLAGDLRFGLPPAAGEVADIAFTDPPYTPDGVRLFLARAAAGLRDQDRGRLLLAYGFSDRTPALGLKTQQAIGEVHLAVEAILPAFNRYDGAQAIGGASDLYVLRPTAKTWRALGTLSDRAATIYTHGPQSAEGSASSMGGLTSQVLGAAAGPEALPVLPVGAGFAGARPVGAVWRNGVPAANRAGAVAVDATAGPPAWLLRLLLGVTAARIAVLVRADHPDLPGDLLPDKWLAEPFVPLPDGHALVVANHVGGGVAGYVLDRPHGKLGNVWREALVRSDGLTKNEARARIGDSGVRPDLLELTPMELPAHLLRDVVGRLNPSASGSGEKD